jgi:tetratricopeptide (TPR) repeat protein
MVRLARILTLVLLLPALPGAGQPASCVPRGGHPMPDLPASARPSMEAALAQAQAEARQAPSDADRLIWLGRRLGYLGRYHDAIEVFTIGHQLHPTDARFLRHRGHRWITLRCLDSAVADLRRAATLVKGRPDEVEPDGMPNARNIPTSTLHSNIWYHLGLALYLKKEYREATAAWKACLKVSRNNDMFAAAANWHHLTLLRSGRTGAARRFLRTVDTGMDLIENADYLAILRLYREATDTTAARMAFAGRQGLSSASYGYGLGRYLLYRGDTTGARAVFDAILKDAPWGAFGYIATEAEGLR